MHRRPISSILQSPLPASRVSEETPDLSLILKNINSNILDFQCEKVAASSGVGYPRIPKLIPEFGEISLLP